jgi:hypothetical protein
MNWDSFLKVLCQRQEYGLTLSERDVILCIPETQSPTKNHLLATYCQSYSEIEAEAFTQRLKNIYKKFQITGRGHKLPQLHKRLQDLFLNCQDDDRFFLGIGLNHIHPVFPRDMFGKAIDQMIGVKDLESCQVDILQTFAPNLNDYSEHLVRCIQNGIQIRILLAWPYSEAAKLREEVLRKYANSMEDVDIREYVIANLETLEKIIKITGNSQLLKIKLYDTLPSLAIYRAGDFMLAAPFLHGSLAINTFQLELALDVANQMLVSTIQKDFELMWQVARYLDPDPRRNWRNDLKVLFTN